MRKAFVGVAGLIGAGKTTLAEKISKSMNLPLFTEPVSENEYLDEFYRDPKKYGFPMQVYLLNHRFQQHQELVWKSGGGVQDRTIYEDSVFAQVLHDQGMMSHKDYRTYEHLSENMFHFLREPDLILYLDVTPEQALSRIVHRNREMEAGITLEYLQGLSFRYEEFYDRISKRVNTVRLDWNDFGHGLQVADILNGICDD